MVVNQIYSIVNGMKDQFTGESAVLNEDLSNIADFGSAVFDNMSFDAVTGYLVDKVGRMIFVDRKYSGFGSSLMRDGWEFGAVLQKVHTKTKNAVKNESWDLVDGRSYDPHVYTKPFVTAKFFKDKTTFEVDLSITDRQLKSAFNTATEMNSFLTMLYNAVDTTLTIAMGNLAHSLINAIIAETLYDQYPDPGSTTPYASASGIRAVNLLYLYNNGPNAGGTALTTSNWMWNKDFLIFASRLMNAYVNRMTEPSTLFNIGGTEKFTPSDKLHVMALEEFESAAMFYMESNTYHKEIVSLPNHEKISFWQGTGTDYAFTSTSAINVTTKNNHTVNTSGILAVMFDHDAAMICNQDRRVTTDYNAKAEFTNYFYKQDASYFADMNENCVVFFVA